MISSEKTEKEEQAEIKAQMREETKIEAEIKKAEQKAIKEEARFVKPEPYFVYHCWF